MGLWAGDKAGGCVRVLYDPTFSERGVLMCAGRKLRAKDPFDFQVRPCRLRCHPLSFGVKPATEYDFPYAARVHQGSATHVRKDAKGCSDKSHSLHGHCALEY